MPSQDTNHKSFTQILNYHSYNRSLKSRNSERLERENTICATLPTICENAQHDKHTQISRVDDIDGRWPDFCQPSDVRLPPLSKQLHTRKVKHDLTLPNLKRRASTPRPVLLFGGSQKLLSDGVGVKGQNMAKLGESSSKLLQVSKVDDIDNLHPLFSVSPNGLERSAPEVDKPRSSCINLKQSITYSDTFKKPLLKREKISPCDLRHISNKQILTSVSSKKL